MRVDSAVERARLLHFRAERTVGLQIVNAEAARIVVRHKRVRSIGVDGEMHRTMRELDRASERSQCPCRRIDLECGDAVPIALHSIAPRDVKNPFRRVWPDILHRERNGNAADLR